MVSSSNLHSGRHLQVESPAVVTSGIMTAPPIGIMHPRISTVAEASAMWTSQALAVISNKATAERAIITITTRATGVATVTMTAEAAINTMMIGVATVAIKTADGNDTEMERIFVRTAVPQICRQFSKKKNKKLC